MVIVDRKQESASADMKPMYPVLYFPWLIATTGPSKYKKKIKAFDAETILNNLIEHCSGVLWNTIFAFYFFVP